MSDWMAIKAAAEARADRIIRAADAVELDLAGTKLATALEERYKIEDLAWALAVAVRDQ